MTKERSGKKKDIFILITVIVTVFFFGIFLKALSALLPQSIFPLEADIEILSDIFSVFVSLSIFTMTWFAYGKSRDKHSLFLGATFLVIGLIDLLHLLSFPGLPDFITENTPQKAGILHSEARLLSAQLLLASTYVYRDNLPKWVDRPFLFLSAMVLFSLSFFPVIYLPESISAAYSQDGLILMHSFRTFITTLLILFACYRYIRRIRETGEKHLEFLVYGFIFLISSDIVYFKYVLSGHLLKVGGFLCIHMGLYKSSVDLPYEKLAEAEDKLRKAAEERYRNLFDNASDAIVTVDLDRNITSWNKAAEKIFGWKEKEVIGEKLPKILVPGFGLAKMEKITASVISGGAISGLDVICPHKNGTSVDVSLSVSPLRDANENIVGMSGILRDITERKEAEKRIRESEDKYRSMVELTTDIIYISDRKGNFIFINDAGFRKLETSQEKVIDQPFSKWIHPEDRERTFKKFMEMIEHGIDVFDFENRFVSNSGRVLNVLHNVGVIRNEKGEIIGTQGIARDITEIKRAAQVQLENERLVYANKAKSDFLANMSHELRTPLNSVIGFSELLRQKFPGDLNVKQEHYVNNVLTSSKFLLNLINDILDLSKVEAGKMELTIEKYPVSQVINETIILLKEKAADHNIILKKELDTDLEFIEADKQRFKQILFNLLSNAIKFSKKQGGTVTIRTKKDSDMAKFSVIDTGIGIKKEDIGLLFRAFEQLDSGISKNYGGTGLGLAITKKLVEMHGGFITVESSFGEGSNFTFSLPVIAKK